MQLGLIAGIVCAIAAVLFALQNVAPVTVTLAFWSFEGSLALVLLVALGLGALIAGLVSSPAMIRRQWAISRMARQITDLEHRLAEEERRSAELADALSKRLPPAEAEMEKQAGKPYVGLRALISGGENPKPPPAGSAGASEEEK